MINIVIGSTGADVAEVLARAFERSYTRGQVRLVDSVRGLTLGDVAVVPSPRDTDLAALEDFARKSSKLVLLGSLGPAIAAWAGLSLDPLEPRLAAAAACAGAPLHGMAESRAVVAYAPTGLGAASPLRRRHLCRFDFTSEWNNLGYGRIGIGDDPWSIAVAARTDHATTVAELVLDGVSRGAVATVRDTLAASILWFARPVGPIDGADWRVIEAFISDYRRETLPCRPHLRDIPHGATAAVTMRLDCDEDIASVRPLLDLYRTRNVPLSVAVMTGQPESPAGTALLADVKRTGGSILSHSSTHRPNWGGSAEAAEAEAAESKAWLESRVAGLGVRYAVSPFHQNPTYVPAALARAGYQGFVGGTICNDPEYLMARGGAVPYGTAGFVSHSQSCMLHGDCMLANGDPLRIYREAFQTARAAGQFFGYLDHPFSPRYSYGWSSEADRLGKHADFLDFMKNDCAGEVLFVNEDTCLDFMRAKAATEIDFDRWRGTFEITRREAASLPLSIGFHGRFRAAHS
jgi:hypothetical protein